MSSHHLASTKRHALMKGEPHGGRYYPWRLAEQQRIRPGNRSRLCLRLKPSLLASGCGWRLALRVEPCRKSGRAADCWRIRRTHPHSRSGKACRSPGRGNGRWRTPLCPEAPEKIIMDKETLQLVFRSLWTFSGGRLFNRRLILWTWTVLRTVNQMLQWCLSLPVQRLSKVPWCLPWSSTRIWCWEGKLRGNPDSQWGPALR